MYTTPATSYYARASDDDGSDLSRQNIIIIAVCSSFGGLFLAYFLYRNIRNCVQRADSTPHPLPQPLSHHRQQQVAQMEQRGTLYEVQFAAGHSIRLDSSSNASLLGTDSPGVSLSIPPSIDTPSDSSHQHLPIPTAPYLHDRDRPSTSSSLASSNASSPPPTGQDSVAPTDSLTAISPRPSSAVGTYSRTPPIRRARPLSMSSTNTYGSIARSSRIYGAPHAPHNQIQIILPTPLSSATASRDSLAVPRGQYGTEAFDRRSVADPWISMPGHMNLGHRSTESLSLPDREPQPRRRHASIAAANPRTHSALYEPDSPPPVPVLSTVSESHTAPPPVGRNKSRRLEKRRESQHGGRINGE